MKLLGRVESSTISTLLSCSFIFCLDPSKVCEVHERFVSFLQVVVQALLKLPKDVFFG